MMNIQNKPRICVVTFPLPSDSIYALLSNFLQILKEISPKVFLITGKMPEEDVPSKNIIVKDIQMKMHLRDEAHPLFSMFKQIITVLTIQFKICYNILKINKITDIIIFFIVGYHILVPQFLARMLGKIIIIYRGSSGIESLHNISIKERLLRILNNLTARLADYIICESRTITYKSELKDWESKIFYATRFIDKKFRTIKNLESRGNSIGYIGRLDKQKGINELLASISSLLNNKHDLRFFIGGIGTLEYKIRAKVKEYPKNINYIGWIHHKHLRKYLNEIKILVLPSYLEGVPTIILEAMACGCIVLASQVGGIPDVIEDGVNGFLLADNSSKQIYEKIQEILDRNDLHLISKNARKTIDNQFTFEAAVERYKKIIENISSGLRF